MKDGPSSKVLDYMRKNRNVEINAEDIASGTGLTRNQAMQAVSYLRKSWDITNPTQGWYVFKGAKGTKSEQVRINSKAKVISLLSDNRVLVEIEGDLYVASRLEV